MVDDPNTERMQTFLTGHSLATVLTRTALKMFNMVSKNLVGDVNDTLGGERLLLAASAQHGQKKLAKKTRITRTKTW